MYIIKNKDAKCHDKTSNNSQYIEQNTPKMIQNTRIISETRSREHIVKAFLFRLKSQKYQKHLCNN